MIYLSAVSQIPEQIKNSDNQVVFVLESLLEKHRLNNPNTNYTSLPKLYSDKKELIKICDYLDIFVIKFCERIGTKLNQIHNVDLPAKSWEILLMGWLTHIIHITYDRYLRLKKAKELFDNKEWILISYKSDKKINEPWPKIVATLCVSENTVANYYGIIAKKLDIKIVEFDYPEFELQKNEKQHNSPNKQIPTIKFKNIVKHNFFYFKEKLKKIIFLTDFKDKKCLFNKKWFSKKDCLYFERKIGADFFEENNFKPEGKFIDRSLLSNIESENKFEKILVELLPELLPEFVLEEFESYYQYADNYKKYKYYFFDNSYYSDTLFNYVMAVGKRNGAKLIGRQHGAGYGQNQCVGCEFIERTISDYFISWGWKDTHYKGAEVIPLPAYNFLQYYDTYNYDNKNNCILVTNQYPLQLYRYYSFSSFENVNKYFDGKDIFLKNSDDEIKENLIYRTYHNNNYGWTEFENNLINKFSEIKVEYKGDLKAILQSIKLYICDHMGTSLLEALVIGTPTILFWDKEMFDERENAKPAFELLRNADILFHNPEDAAKKVNEIWDNVLEWWNEPHRQTARLEFLKMQCNVDKNWKKIWVEKLNCELKKILLKEC